MKVSPQCVVSLTWVLNDTSGDLLDQLDEPADFLVGAGDLLPAIDAALQGHSAGTSLDIALEPHEAFGDYDENKVFLEARHLFAKTLEEGELLRPLPQGCNPDAPKDLAYTVTDIYPDHVVLDGNHPLAGMGLRLSLKIHTVTEATIEEVGAGTCGTGFFKL